MRKFLWFCGILLSLAFLPGAEVPPGEYRQLINQGFPQDYAVKLAWLKRRHPNWEFVPLRVSKLEKRYTWDYVLEQETVHPKRSLVSGSLTCQAYFHQEDGKEYDAGCRRASREAVAFFLDPRNFLNERDIFQFEDLRCEYPVPLHTVQAILKGTFMEKQRLENGKTYAAYFLWLGNKLKISPLHLAARARSEQGLTGTPLVSGKCGSLLWKYYSKKIKKEGRYSILAPESGFNKADLLALDNLYNYFNQEAAGTGRFTIYLNGMREALRGTPELAKEWRNDPKWNTRWKALYGGAFKVAEKYVGNYQNTPYLQKWNVDPRSKSPAGNRRNFWGQYMQNIGAAFSEGCSAYEARRKQKMLNYPLHFLIPVYSKMPEKVSPDPANGKCPHYPRFTGK